MDAGTSWYQTLGIDTNTVDVLSLSERDISRFYRKAALRWHPDKNPNDPSAASKFSQIFIAYEKLSDEGERQKCNEKIMAARDKQKRFVEMDEDRKKMREELLEREREARLKDESDLKMNHAAFQRMQTEVCRLREEGLQKDREEALRRRAKSVVKGGAERQAGVWRNVDGFSSFFTVGSSSFEQFEQDVLDGTFGS